MANVSKRSVDNIISLIIALIVSLYNNKENNSNNKEQNIDKDSIDAASYLLEGKNFIKEERTCIEQILVKKVDSELKKLEIKIQNLKINLYNDNYMFKYLTIILNSLKIERNSVLYVGNNINNDLHLIIISCN